MENAVINEQIVDLGNNVTIDLEMSKDNAIAFREVLDRPMESFKLLIDLYGED